jgi:hypothetical protein
MIYTGGPAEKGGLQQGDKILEWCGISLVDRSFEEVCSIMSFSESEYNINSNAFPHPNRNKTYSERHRRAFG